MRSPSEIRSLVDRVTSYTPEEREHIYRKYFTKPSSTVRFLCEHYGFDQKRVLDATCHYGYFLAYFGEGSKGTDGTPHYLQFAKDMGFDAQVANIEEGLPAFPAPFEAIVFSGTLEEVLSPHVVLIRFHELLQPDGLLCLRVPVVPPGWFERLARIRLKFGYKAAAHLYFFTPRIIDLMLQRAGYEVVEIVSSGVMMNPLLRPFHRLLLPLTPTITVIARSKPDFKYPPIRAMRFLPSWAMDLAPYHEDFEAEKV
jgi:SAM-dependent methyltransferase